MLALVTLTTDCSLGDVGLLGALKIDAEFVGRF